jgi:dihydrofolate synthase/folylpolyglutamate synthase
LLEALRADEFDQVVCCTAPTVRGLPAAELLKAARAIGCDDAVAVDDVGLACDRVLANATAEDAILVTGSLYVVGAARGHLSRVLP